MTLQQEIGQKSASKVTLADLGTRAMIE